MTTRLYHHTPPWEWETNETAAFLRLMDALGESADNGQTVPCAQDLAYWDNTKDEVKLQICADCPVRAVCGEYAEWSPSAHGVWGGKVYQGSARKS